MPSLVCFSSSTIYSKLLGGSPSNASIVTATLLVAGINTSCCSDLSLLNVLCCYIYSMYMYFKHSVIRYTVEFFRFLTIIHELMGCTLNLTWRENVRIYNVFKIFYYCTIILQQSCMCSNQQNIGIFFTLISSVLLFRTFNLTYST